MPMWAMYPSTRGGILATTSTLKTPSLRLAAASAPIDVNT